MSHEINQIISDFNDILLSLALNIANVCPNTIIGTNIRDIEKAIKKDNQRKFIDLFCIKVLQYKDQIDLGDESFFMSKDYKGDFDDQNSSALNHVISMKSVWSLLKNENKKIVIMNMQILCALAQQYFQYVSNM